MSQTEMFFSLANTLRTAARNGDVAAVAEAADELAVLWGHAEDDTLRQRCAALLTEHGMADAMAIFSAQWAAV